MLTNLPMMLAGATSPLKVAADGGGFWLPPSASTSAEQVDSTYYLVLGVSTAFMVLLLGLLALILFRYRQSRHPRPERVGGGGQALVLLSSVVPALLLLGIFWSGFKGFMDLESPPSDSVKIQVTARQSKWEFTYSNGNVTNDLHLPYDSSATLVMTSQSETHSLWIPAFRIKQVVMPGKTTEAWVRATRPGVYAAFCAEYCGTDHSDMTAEVVVHGPGGYRSWLDSFDPYGGMTPLEAGAKVYSTKGCLACHTVNGQKSVGPTWQGIYGTTENTDKGPVTIDDEYIKESILDPNARIVEGFQPVMPPMPLTPEEIAFVTEYIKSLKGG